MKKIKEMKRKRKTKFTWGGGLGKKNQNGVQLGREVGEERG